MKKYELTHEAKEILGIRLCRIKALRDFADVKAGDLGGFIQSEENLDHEGNCWVSDNAIVCENVRVYGNALVSDSAIIHDSAIIYNNARVYGKARVYDGARVFGNAEVTGNARVSGDARVYDGARVFGNAEVYGNAGVFGNARVFDNARVFGSAIVTALAFTAQGPRHHITVTDTHTIIGCEIYPHEFWIKNIEEIGLKHSYLDRDIETYKHLVFSLIQSKTGKKLIHVR